MNLEWMIESNLSQSSLFVNSDNTTQQWQLQQQQQQQEQQKKSFDAGTCMSSQLIQTSNCPEEDIF